MQELIEKLKEWGVSYKENEPLYLHTSFKLGGPADVMILPEDVESIRKVLQVVKEREFPLYVLGNGSNVLFSDEGFRGVVLKLGKNFSSYEINGNVLKAQAGALLSKVCKKAARKSLGGAEFATGIPGSVGGGVVMNAGAYDGELKDVISKVTAISLDGDIKEFSNEEMRFGYRTSAVLEENLLVLEVEMTLPYKNHDEIWAKIDDYTTRRWTKQPLDLPSAGSTFKRPPGYYAGKLIQDSGLKGMRYKDVMVSSLHSGFVVSVGEATSKDVRTLIKIIQRRVKQEFGVELETEVKIIDEK